MKRLRELSAAISSDKGLSRFDKMVLIEALSIPLGRVSTYGSIAKNIGRPGAARAVGNALGRNPFAPQVPCHRVIRSDGAIGGYRFGILQKRALLASEGIVLSTRPRH